MIQKALLLMAPLLLGFVACSSDSSTGTLQESHALPLVDGMLLVRGDSAFFYLDQHEVTQMDYLKHSSTPSHWNDSTCMGMDSLGKWKLQASIPSSFRGDSLPAICVTHSEASAYCAKLGKRLPTTPEWRTAFQGGKPSYYFWGDSLSGTEACQYGNIMDRSLSQVLPSTHAIQEQYTNCQDGYGMALAPVLAFRPNPYGFYGMAGNVWEWTSTSRTSTSTSYDNLGGSWRNSASALYTFRIDNIQGEYASSSLGFRCAKDK